MFKDSETLEDILNETEDLLWEIEDLINDLGNDTLNDLDDFDSINGQSQRKPDIADDLMMYEIVRRTL